MKNTLKLSTLTFLVILSCISLTFAQNQFYKQFKGKIGDNEIRVELIKAPSKDNPHFNLRGSYYYERIGSEIQLKQGNIDNLGNIYMEEGVSKRDYNGQNSFVKTGVFRGMYYANLGRIEGEWQGVNGQRFAFYFQEDYSNGSIPAEIIFNDLSYESAEIRFHYPRFESHPQTNNINQFIQKNILGDMQTKMIQFINNYQETASLGGMADGFENSNIGYIRHNENQIMVLEYSTNDYQGGAHGIYQSAFYNFNLQTGGLINLNDVLVKDYEAPLTKVAEQVFRSKYGMKPDQSLGEYGFTFSGNAFKLTPNYYIHRQGIGFFYNVYEIAPYAVGYQELFIPYEQIKTLIKKNGLLNEFVK